MGGKKGSSLGKHFLGAPLLLHLQLNWIKMVLRRTFCFRFAGSEVMFTRNWERMGRERWGLRKNRGVWEWMKKEPRASENWRLGWLVLRASGCGWPSARFQRCPRTRGFLLFWPPPCGLCTLSVHKAEARGLRPIHQVRFLGFCSLPLTKMCSLCKVPFWFLFCFVFIVELICGFLPAQQSFLGFSDSLWTRPMKPPGPAHCPLSGTARARWCGATGLSPSPPAS